ncbi:hypothetical protein BST28_08885 [Mycolicibacter kumamotonensis]|uniref:DUF2993 domain-containing protein n=1 Tax=Mycolicibacter kumamotonensis TaxID=354243 RepID=A0A1X0E765_9MYCO|nr:mannan chain length control protein LmeA [Mycolicibacter kumamotonensis]ORA80516.1 hypothetical protein BST28_08885 [Mycolicibacter kumamotonensis]
MRRVLIGISAVIAALAVTVAGVDFGTSVYAEYQLSRAVRQATDLGSDPFVAILGFPFIPQARRDHYDEVEIKAPAVEQPMIGKAMLEATMHSVDLREASWRFRPGAKIPVAKLESRIIIGSVYLGRYLGIRDLMVEAPPSETNDATGGTTESGISSSHGLVFTGTPAGYGKRVSVAVDLSIAGTDHSTLVITPTGVLTGPDTANQHVPEEQRAAVLAAFSGSLPQQRLPFGLVPTSQGARGSDVIIEGIAADRTITLPEFRQS